VRLNETFGPTVQGEGPHAGQQVGFIRLAECNLACTWCDTPYTWDWSKHDRAIESIETPVDEIANLAHQWQDRGINRIVVTGGEPLMQQDDLTELMDKVWVLWDVETNGTIAPKDSFIEHVDLFCVSPKLSNSGNLEKKAIKTNALNTFAELASVERAIFKFVVANEDDFNTIQDLAAVYDIPKHSIWVMPEGANRDTHLAALQKLAPTAVELGYNVSTRMHLLIWDTKRGV
jgi:organic radical activating enzyme